MNRNVFRLTMIVFAVIIAFFAVGRIIYELRNRGICVLQEEERGIYTISGSAGGGKVISFLRLLERKDINDVSAVYISPDEIKLNPEKIHEVLENRRLSVILLEKVRQPDPGELPVYYSSLKLIRGHKIPSDEWKKMDDRRRVFRLRRAVIERNIKVIFLPKGCGYIETKLLPLIKPYMKTSHLTAAGKFRIPGIVERALLLMAILSLLYFLKGYFSPARLLILFFALLVLSLIFSYSGHLRLFSNGLAVFLVVFLVVHAFGMFLSSKNYFFLLTGYSFMVGVILYALHSTPDFQYYLLRFRGVKAAFFIPLMICFFQVAIYVLSEHIDVRRSLPFIGAIFIIGLIIVIIRSGNRQLLPSSFEEKIRSFFEISLYARPRFKEFLIGHPLLFLAFSKFKYNKRYILLFPFGMIGQVSLINSFFHFTHPLHIILLSSVWSVLLGLLMGLILLGLVNLIEKGLGKR